MKTQYLLKLVCTQDEYIYNITEAEAKQLKKLLNKGRLEVEIKAVK